MRLSAWPLLVLTGCTGALNPCDLSDERARYQEMVEDSWRHDLLLPYSHPQEKPQAFEAADLEAWRDTVLAAADEASLLRLRTGCRLKVEQIERRCADLLRTDPFNREPELTAEAGRLDLEKRRLAMVEERLTSGLPNRAR